jgi:hypothetical protein
LQRKTKLTNQSTQEKLCLASQQHDCRPDNDKRRSSMSGLDKPVGCYEEALAGLIDGMTVLAGGVDLCGIPENLIAEIHRRGVTTPR